MTTQVERHRRTYPEKWVPAVIDLTQRRPEMAEIGLGPVAEVFLTT